MLPNVRRSSSLTTTDAEPVQRDGGLNPGILSSGQELSVVSKAEYENLLLIARHFTNLRRNLTNNGVSDKAIDVGHDL